MSIAFDLTRADGTTDSIPVTGQKTATEFFGKLTKEHGFRILIGVYPVWVEEADLRQLIFELSVIRDAIRAMLALDARFTPENCERIDCDWDQIIDFVRPLANEHGWKISIG